MSRPMDRDAVLPAIGAVDEEAGEFWVDNPFMMMTSGKNLSAYERNRLFLNRNGNDFVDASFASDADIDSDSRSVIPTDFDNDGNIDLLVGSVGGGPLRLFKNQIPTGNSVRIDLVNNNRAAIGSRVVLHCGQRKIVRDLFGANGFMGQSPAELHIGVGAVDAIDKLEVHWAEPSGMRVQEFENLPVNCRIKFTIDGDAPEISE